MSYILVISSSLMSIAYTAMVCNFFDDRLEIRVPKWVFYLVLLVAPALIGPYLTYNLNFTVLYLVMYLMATVSFLIVFKSDILTKLYCGCYYSYHLLIVKGVFYSIYCLYNNVSLYTAAQDVDLHFIMTSLAAGASMLIMYIGKSIRKPDELSATQTNLNVATLHIIWIIMIFDTFSYSINISSDMLTIYHMGLYLALYFLNLTVYFTSTQMRNYRAQTSILESQLESQLNHYNSQADYIQDYRMLNDVYSSQLKGLKYVVDTNDIDAIKDYVNKLDKTVDNVKEITKYSNNVLIDAIMQDIASECAKDKIKFSTELTLPPEFKMDDYDVSAVFTHLMNNALAGAKTSLNSANPFIAVKTENNGSWLTITFENSYVSNRKYSIYGIQDSTTPGLKYTENILNKYDAVMIIEPRMDIYCVTITYPLKDNLTI